jgi:hypothetical protein
MPFVERYLDFENLALFLKKQGDDADGTSRVIAAMNGPASTELKLRADQFHKAAEWMIWLARNADKVERLSPESWNRKPKTNRS